MKKVFLMIMLAVPLSLFAQKFGHVNIAEIVQSMPEYTKAQTEIQALQKQYQDDLQRMQDELQKKSDEYDKTKATLPDNIKQRREQELQELYQRIQQSYQDNQKALQENSQTKMSLISQKVTDAVKAIGAAGNYIYIMDSGSGIPYISTTLSTDVTTQVKTKLGLK